MDRFAIIRLRTESASIQLRSLLHLHGFQEVNWIDADGRPTSPPPLVEDSPTGDQPIQTAEGQAPPSQYGGFTIGQFLTLPTVLTQFPASFPPSVPLPQLQVRSSSVVLPLAHAAAATTFSAPTTAANELAPSSSRSAVVSRPVEESAPTTAFVAPAEQRTSEVGDVAATSESGPLESLVSQSPLRPRGKKPQNPPDDQNLYYTCQLCKNKILGTRVSNLQNHVRRHAMLKQFQCCYCEYTHNEIAKVRLHMTNNHKDSESQPVNNLNTDMQSVWRALFRQCFPTRVQRRRGGGGQKNPGPSGVSQRTTHSPGASSSTTRIASASASNPGVSLSMIQKIPLAMRRRRRQVVQNDRHCYIKLAMMILCSKKKFVAKSSASSMIMISSRRLSISRATTTTRKTAFTTDGDLS